MRGYNVGEKFVVEIDKVFEQDGEKLYRAKGMKSLVFDANGLRKLTPLSNYSQQWEKIADQRSVLGFNAGQEEVWKLALKLRYMDYEDKVECFGLGYDGKEKWIEIMEKYTYAEAAAKVADWERKKEEICVGDVVTFHGNCGLVTFIGQNIKGISKSGLAFITCKEECTKTGRHIDIASMLAQIGGESND